MRAGFSCRRTKTLKRPNRSGRLRPAHPESGNAFFIILLGVVLFAALMFVFTRSAKQGAGNMTRRQAQLAADDILNFAQTVQRGVDRVYANDCPEGQLNFDQGFDAGYANAAAPADRHCNIFDPAGGGVQYRTVPPDANDGSPWIFTGSDNVAAATFGTAAPDLVVVVDHLDLAVCQQLNALLKITGVPAEQGSYAVDKFTGTFAASDQIGSGDGARAECTASGGSYRFYSVLLER